MSMGSRTPRKFISRPIPITRIDTLSLFCGIKNFKLSVHDRFSMLTKVNNESSEIIRILNSAFDEFLPEKYATRDFYPEPLREKIDEINSWVYDLYNNGVYKVSPFHGPLGNDRRVLQMLKRFVPRRSRESG